MEIPIFKIFMIFGIVSGWAKTALADGKVTLLEAVALVTELAAILGIKTELEIPTALPAPLPEQEQIDETLDAEPSTAHQRPAPRT